MTYHPQNGCGYDHMTVLKFFVCCDAAHRAGLSGTAQLLVNSSCDIARLKFKLLYSITTGYFQSHPHFGGKQY